MAEANDGAKAGLDPKSVSAWIAVVAAVLLLFGWKDIPDACAHLGFCHAAVAAGASQQPRATSATDSAHNPQGAQPAVRAPAAPAPVLMDTLSVPGPSPTRRADEHIWGILGSFEAVASCAPNCEDVTAFLEPEADRDSVALQWSGVTSGETISVDTIGGLERTSAHVLFSLTESIHFVVYAHARRCAATRCHFWVTLYDHNVP